MQDAHTYTPLTIAAGAAVFVRILARCEGANQGLALDRCVAMAQALWVMCRALPGVVLRSAVGRRDERWRLAGSLGLAAFVHGVAVVAIRAYAAGAVANQFAVSNELEAPNLEWQASEALTPELAADRRLIADASDAARADGSGPELHPGARFAFRERRSNSALPAAPGTAVEGEQAQIARHTAALGALARTRDTGVGARSAGLWSFGPVSGSLAGARSSRRAPPAQQS